VDDFPQDFERAVLAEHAAQPLVKAA